MIYTLFALTLINRHHRHSYKMLKNLSWDTEYMTSVQCHTVKSYTTY